MYLLVTYWELRRDPSSPVATWWLLPGRSLAASALPASSHAPTGRIDQPRSREEVADEQKAPSNGWRSKVRGRGGWQGGADVGCLDAPP